MAAHHCQGTGASERRSWLSSEAKAKLEAVVEHIGQPGKGISACDESSRTIDPRFRKVGVEPTEEHRRAYRQALFEAEGAPECVSGAILDPETVFQMSDQGVPLPQLLAARGILPGVKPSLTVYKLPGCDGEMVMQGLDSLAVRLAEYREAGCVFAKWRSPLTVDVAAGEPARPEWPSSPQPVQHPHRSGGPPACPKAAPMGPERSALAARMPRSGR